jgi:hypothetical protein
MGCDPIILSNTIIVLNPVMVLEREPERMDKVTLFIPGLAPHVFEGSDAHELWKFFDNRPPEWK